LSRAASGLQLHGPGSAGVVPTHETVSFPLFLSLSTADPNTEPTARMTSIFQNSAVYSLSSSASQPALSSASSRPKQLYQKGKLTEEGRAHLLAIKQREELKNHLVTKYETKYGEKVLLYPIFNLFEPDLIS
jgi:hypothetical protein